jgi:hypothetical protein
MFRHRDAIIRELFRTEDFNPQHANLDIVSPLSFKFAIDN